MVNFLVNLFGLASVWIVWLWLIFHPLTNFMNLAVAVGCTLAIIPIVYMGRWLLERQPDIPQAQRITLAVHYLVAIFLGAAILTATRLGLSAPLWPVPLAPWLGLVVMLLSGLILLLVVFNLALKGLGAPFAIALTRLVVTDWMYAWTRNPMVVSALAFLVGLGLWLGSGLFLVWVLAIVSPALLVFLKVYEERELEIRFGQAYLEYKDRTPMLLPKWPRRGKPAGRNNTVPQASRARGRKA